MWNYTEKSIFAFNNALHEHYRHLFPENITLLDLKFTAYAPNVLADFMEMDHAQELSEAVSPKYNYQ